MPNIFTTEILYPLSIELYIFPIVNIAVAVCKFYVLLPTIFFYCWSVKLYRWSVWMASINKSIPPLQLLWKQQVPKRGGIHSLSSCTYYYFLKQLWLKLMLLELLRYFRYDWIYASLLFVGVSLECLKSKALKRPLEGVYSYPKR